MLFYLGPRALEMLRAPRYVYPALHVTRKCLVVTHKQGKFGLAASVCNDFSLFTKRIVTLFQVFTIVLPNALLFISLKTYFSNSFFASVLI